MYLSPEQVADARRRLLAGETTTEELADEHDMPVRNIRIVVGWHQMTREQQAPALTRRWKQTQRR